MYACVCNARGGEGYDYESVRRWTNGVDLFVKDKILVPININGEHWAVCGDPCLHACYVLGLLMV